MKINNYLLKIEKERNKKYKENICIHGVSSITKSIYLELKKYYRKEVIKKIQKKLNVPYSTFYSWISDSNPIPISKIYSLLDFWRKIFNKNKKDFEEKWCLIYSLNKGFSQNGQRKVILPQEVNEDLAYLIGFFQGDGHLKKEKSSGFQECSIYFYEANKEVLENINEKIAGLFGIKGNIYFQSNKKGKVFILRICSKPIYLFFRNVLNLTAGKKVRNINVPKIVKNMDLPSQVSFIRGFFDAEGGVGETSKNPWLDIGQASSDFPCEILIWIHKILKKQGIKLSEPRRTKNQEFFRIRTAKRETIKRFFELVSSDHIEKIDKFNKIINK